MMSLTQKLHVKKKLKQTVDFVDYFTRVTIEWGHNSPP
jgi:hypothetical protein